MANKTCPPLSFDEWPTLTQPVVKKCLRSCCVKQLFSTQSTEKSAYKVTIPFHRLPLLVQVQAIQTMCLKDWINLAMTSKRNERVIKLARIKTKTPCVEINWLYSCIKFPSLKLCLRYDTSDWETDNLETMYRQDLRSWLNKWRTSTITELAILYQKMQNIFVFPNNLIISFCTDDMSYTASIQGLQSNEVMKNWSKLTVNGKTICWEDLKIIMDTASSNRKFDCRVENMPLNFRHEKAFKFSYQVYYDARWVKIEDLYGLRNLAYVCLEWNLFTQHQLKSYVNYWVDSEVDMFSWLKMTKSLDFDSFVDGLLGLYGSDPFIRFFFTLSKSSLNKRRNTMLIISYDVEDHCLLMEAWDINKKYTPGRSKEVNKYFENIDKILTLLHTKKTLEDLWKMADEEGKREWDEKINKSIAELAKFKVFFVDGKATLDLF
ncbi:unnamed protein product [Caenorhabditis brenneri]